MLPARHLRRPADGAARRRRRETPASTIPPAALRTRVPAPRRSPQRSRRPADLRSHSSVHWARRHDPAAGSPRAVEYAAMTRLSRREALGVLGTAAGGGLLTLHGIRLDAQSATFPRGAIIRTLSKDIAPHAIAGSTLFHEHLSI